MDYINSFQFSKVFYFAALTSMEETIRTISSISKSEESRF